MNEPKSLTRLCKDRIELICAQKKSMRPIIIKFYSLVPRDAKVGVLLREQCWDYPLFGEKLERTIVPINLEIIQDQRFDYIVIIDDILGQNAKLKEFIIKNYKKAEILGRSYEPINPSGLFVLDEWALYLHQSSK